MFVEQKVVTIPQFNKVFRFLDGLVFLFDCFFRFLSNLFFNSRL